MHAFESGTTLQLVGTGVRVECLTEGMYERKLSFLNRADNGWR